MCGTNAAIRTIRKHKPVLELGTATWNSSFCINTVEKVRMNGARTEEEDDEDAEQRVEPREEKRAAAQRVGAAERVGEDEHRHVELEAVGEEDGQRVRRERCEEERLRARHRERERALDSRAELQVAEEGDGEVRAGHDRHRRVEHADRAAERTRLAHLVAHRQHLHAPHTGHTILVYPSARADPIGPRASCEKKGHPAPI